MQKEKHAVDHRRPIALDLFAGAGGLSLGLEQAGFDVVASVEFDPIHAAVHRYNFPRTEVLCVDVADQQRVNANTLRQAVREGLRMHGRDIGRWDGEIDAICGGPPCQGYSFVGKRNVKDERNFLIYHFARIVEELRPRYFVMENVPGIMSGKHSAFLDSFVARMKNAGYLIPTPQVLNASEFGVPQDRKRVIVIGSRNDVVAAEYPRSKYLPPFKRRDSANLGKSKGLGIRISGPTVWDALRDLPTLSSLPKLYKSDELDLNSPRGRRGASKRFPTSYGSRLRGTERDPGDYSYERCSQRHLWTNTGLTRHAAFVVNRFKSTKRGAQEPVSRFHRLDPHGLSSTLRAGTAAEYGGYTSPRPIHPYQDRVITVREAARLHSFPDWFRFNRTKWHGFREVGNSVPPLLGRAIGSSIIAALGILPVRPRKVIELGDESVLDLSVTRASKLFHDPLSADPKMANVEAVPRRRQNRSARYARSKEAA